MVAERGVMGRTGADRVRRGEGGGVANEDTAAAWDGEEGAYWADHADRYDRSVAAHHARLFAVAPISADHMVLDVGCGSGRTTCDAARRALPGEALGVDLSGPMLAVARERTRAEGIDNARFEHSDAQTHSFPPDAFDVVISRFGVMFFDDPVAAFANIAAAQPPGGRLVFVAWRELAANEWMSTVLGALALGRPLPVSPPGTPGPFAFADPGRVEQVLEDAGYESIELTRIDEPAHLGTDADDASAFIAASGIGRGMLGELDDKTAQRALDALHSAFEAHATNDGVVLGSSAWLVSAARGA
jgi:SAM-dependent methyltransferase